MLIYVYIYRANESTEIYIYIQRVRVVGLRGAYDTNVRNGTQDDTEDVKMPGIKR